MQCERRRPTLGGNHWGRGALTTYFDVRVSPRCSLTSGRAGRTDSSKSVLCAIKLNCVSSMQLLSIALTAAYSNTTTHGTTRHDTTRHDTTRHDTTRHDTTRHDTTRHDTTRHDTTRHDTTRHDTTRHDTTRHDTTQHNTTQHNTTTFTQTSMFTSS